MLITKREEVTKQDFRKILWRKLRPWGSPLLEFIHSSGCGGWGGRWALIWVWLEGGGVSAYSRLGAYSNKYGIKRRYSSAKLRMYGGGAGGKFVPRPPHTNTHNTTTTNLVHRTFPFPYFKGKALGTRLHHHHHYTNVCKLSRLWGAISLLVFNKWLSNQAILLILGRCFQWCQRIFPNLSM